MTEATRLSVSVNNSARGGAPSEVTLNKIIELIKSHNLDEETTKHLISMASQYPTNALYSFQKNINFMIQRAKAKRKKYEQKEDSKD